MQLEHLVHSLSVASLAVLLIEEKTNDEGKKNITVPVIIENCLHKRQQ